MFPHRRLIRLLAGGPVGALLAVGLSFVAAAQVQAQVVVHTRAEEVSGPLDGVQIRRLPFAARHVALYWAGNPDATVTVGFSTDGTMFTAALDAERDEVGEQRRDGQTYGAVLPAGGAIAARLTSDRPLGRLTVLALADGITAVHKSSVPGNAAGASPAQPPIVSRSDWGADESLRFDRRGKEVWPPVFQTMQKLVVHHTAGANNDTDPKATIRAIYYYHAVTQGWGDIGYHFLIDEAGNIYKGRHSHTTASSSPTANDDTISGENGSAQSVTAGHAFGYNSGTIGIALLGTLTNQDATESAKGSLRNVLAWKAGAHGINPTGSSLYTNPLNGTQATFPNIAAHREVPDNTTDCPGDFFVNNTLAGLRDYVAANTPPPDATAPSVPSPVTATAGKRKITVSWPPSTDTGNTGGISGVAGYEIHRSSTSTGSFTLLARTTVPTYVDGAIHTGTSYWYTVKAYDGAGNLTVGGSAPVNGTAL